MDEDDTGMGKDESEEDEDDYEDLQEFIVDDDGNNYDFEAERRREREHRLGKPAALSAAAVAPGYNFPKLQETFQPNSTPLRGNRQYLGEYIDISFRFYT